jgi:uncharacterized protein YndB with AHSA1/START domain
MFYPGSFNVSTPTDREILVTRDFNAPRHLVYDAFTKPELVRRWLLGPPGWTMPICEIDLKVGGAYRYLWRKPGEKDMGMGGIFREIIAPERVVATEKFDESWYPGEALNTTVFVEQGGITTTSITILYESKEARDTARRSGMEQGMAAGYTRLDELLSTMGCAT